MTQMLKILIVDDETITRSYVAKILSQLGHENVFCSSDGLDAWSQFQVRTFDLVLLDLDMPGLGGQQLIQRMKSIHPEVCIVVVTGTDNEEVSNQLLSAGVKAVVTKPFSKDQLAGALALEK